MAGPISIGLSHAVIAIGALIMLSSASQQIRARALGAALLTLIFTSPAAAQSLNPQIHLMRLTSLGAADSTFGSSGNVYTDAPVQNWGDVADSAMDSSGRIVVVATDHSTSPTGWYIRRYTATGTTDTMFGTSGVVETTFSGAAAPAAVGIDSAGRIVVGGYVVVSGAKRFAVARYTSAGVADSGFSGDGEYVFDFSGSTSEWVEDLAIDDDDSIILAGTATRSGYAQFAVARVLADGTLDNVTPFGDFNNGKMYADFGAGAGAHAVVIDHDSRIYLAGYMGDEAAVARFTSTGELDGDFGGGDGMRTYSVWDGILEANALAIDPATNRLVVGSTVSYPNSANPYDQYYLMRFIDDGNYDISFGTYGKTRTDFGGSTQLLSMSINA